MGRTCLKTSIFFFSVFLSFYLLNQNALALSDFRISQVNSNLDPIRVYMDISDESSNMIPGILPKQLTATIGAESAAINSVIPFSATKEGVAYIFLVDISKSLKESQLVKIRSALTAWIEGISKKDRVLIMTFGSEVKLVQDFTPKKDVLKSKVANIKAIDNNTRLHLGLVKAMEYAGRTDPDLPSRRVIVTLSDGRNDYTGGMTKEEVLDKIEEFKIPIYAIGYFNPPASPVKESFLEILGRFSRDSGGKYYRAEGNSFGEMYSSIKKRIHKVYIADLQCSSCKRDGRLYRLQITFSHGHKAMSDGRDIRLLPIKKKESMSAPASENPSQEESAKKYFPPILPITIGLAVFLFIVLAIKIKGTRKSDKNMADPDSLAVDPEIADLTVSTVNQAPDPDDSVTIRMTRIGGDDTTDVHTFVLTDTLVIGRTSPGSDIVIKDDSEISGRHCQFLMTEGRVSVIDLESTNGTSINGIPVNGKQSIENDDMLLIGRSEFRVSIIKDKS